MSKSIAASLIYRLATGRTALAATCSIGAQVVGCAFDIDLVDVGDRVRLESSGHEVHAAQLASSRIGVMRGLVMVSGLALSGCFTTIGATMGLLTPRYQPIPEASPKDGTSTARLDAARAEAVANHCATVTRILDELASSEPDYVNYALANDADIRRCVALPRDRKVGSHFAEGLGLGAIADVVLLVVIAIKCDGMCGE